MLFHLDETGDKQTHPTLNPMEPALHDDQIQEQAEKQSSMVFADQIQPISRRNTTPEFSRAQRILIPDTCSRRS